MDWSRLVYLHAPKLRKFKEHANEMLKTLSKNGICMENVQVLKVTAMLNLFTLCVLQLICIWQRNPNDRIKTFPVGYELFYI